MTSTAACFNRPLGETERQPFLREWRSLTTCSHRRHRRLSRAARPAPATARRGPRAPPGSSPSSACLSKSRPRPGDVGPVEILRGALHATKASGDLRLPAGNPLGLPPGKIGHARFTATATAGGPGVGQLDLKIMGLDFPGTVEHGQIAIGS